MDERDRDISSVKVFSTDELIADGLDGRAIQIDPGKHRLRFLLPWGAVLSSDVLIREGEKNRVIQVKINSDAESGDSSKSTNGQPAPSTLGGAPASMPPAASEKRRSPPAAAWILAGTSLAAFGAGATFALLGSSKKSDIDACSPNCGSNAHPTYDALKRDYLIADIAFAAGFVSAGFATWLFLAPSSPKQDSPPISAMQLKGLSLTPMAFALPRGGALGMSGGF